MDLYSLDRTRCAILEDHCYFSPYCPTDVEQCESLFTHEIDTSLTFEGVPEDEIRIDVDSPDESVMFTNRDKSPRFSTLAIPYRDPDLSKTASRKQWIFTAKSLQKKVVRLLEKVVLHESIDSCHSADLSEFSFAKKAQAFKHLWISRVARFIRNAFANLSWCQESCFSFHHWCLSHLPTELLPVYCEGYKRLWHQNKVTTLLHALNQMLLSRSSALQWTPDSPAHELLSLVASSSPGNKLQHVIQTTLSARPGMHASISCRRTNVAEPPSDQPVLACLTFPASSNSNRLCSLLCGLSNFGRVSVETPEEQACDLMRLRLRLYVRRVLTLLEEPKQCPVYMVGFGVGSILILLAVLRLYSFELRRERRGVAGVICLGIPLMGLKGPRGCQNDPLLALPPDVPMLFIVGSNSRLGGQKHALYFRRQLLLALRRSRTRCATPDLADDDQTCDSASSDSNRPFKISQLNSNSVRGPGIHVVNVGGADHLLRMRPSVCMRWCTTQEDVDCRVLASVERFIRHTERSAHSTECNARDTNGEIPRCDLSRNDATQPNLAKLARNLSSHSYSLLSTAAYHSEGGSSHPPLSQTRKLHSYLRRPYTSSSFSTGKTD